MYHVENEYLAHCELPSHRKALNKQKNIYIAYILKKAKSVILWLCKNKSPIIDKNHVDGL